PGTVPTFPASMKTATNKLKEKGLPLTWRERADIRFEQPSTIRHKEMREVFHRAYRMKVSDALELANRAIELLGI
ncbi:MAG: hypothetical protein ACREA2_03410, partial [Blastocatellia bacterium]